MIDTIKGLLKLGWSANRIKKTLKISHEKFWDIILEDDNIRRVWDCWEVDGKMYETKVFLNDGKRYIKKENKMIELNKE